MLAEHFLRRFVRELHRVQPILQLSEYRHLRPGPHADCATGLEPGRCPDGEASFGAFRATIRPVPAHLCIEAIWGSMLEAFPQQRELS